MPQVPYSPLPTVAPATGPATFFTPSATADSFGAGIGRGLATLGESLGNIAERQKQEQLTQQNYDLTSDALKLDTWNQEQNTLAAQKAQGTNAYGYADARVKAYDEEVSKRLANISDPRLRAAWKVKYDQGREATKRSAFQTELSIRDTTNKTKLKSDFDDLYKKIDDNPQNRDSYIQAGYALVDALPDTSPEAKELMKKSWKESALVVYGNARVKQPGGPEAVADALTPKTQTDAEKQAMQVLMSRGYPKHVAAGIVGNLIQESSLNPNANNPADGSDGSDSIGIGQWNAARARALKSFAERRGLDWRSYTVQIDFLDHELNTTESRAGAALKGARTTAEAAAIFADMYERPAGSGKGNPELISGWKNRLRHSLRLANEAMNPADAALQELPYAQRSSMRDLAINTGLNVAKTVEAQRQVQYKSEIDAFEISLLKGLSSRADIENRLAIGGFSTAADYKRMLEAADKFDKGISDAAYGRAMVDAGVGQDPWKSKNKDGMNAWYRSIPESSEKLKQGLDAGVKTGVMPEDVVSDLRRAIVSTNPTVQLEALTLASRILQEYPNAFAGVANKDVVENNALWFNERLTATGDPKKAQDYVNQRNDPANAQKFKVRDEEAAQFKKELVEKDAAAAVQKILDDTWFFTDIGRSLTKDPLQGGTEVLPVFKPTFQAGQKGAAINAYSQYAYEGYQLTGTKDGAKTYAENKMKQTWGVYEGKIMQYPPNKAYPADPDGNYNYIAEQAAKDIEKTILAETKQVVKVDPSQVIFQPLDNGRTAQDFATRQRPPRYALFYYTNINGIPELHMMRQPGSTRQGEWWSYGPDIVGPPMPAWLVGQTDEAEVKAKTEELGERRDQREAVRRNLLGLPPAEPPAPAPQEIEARPWNQGYDPYADMLRDQRNMRPSRRDGGPR